MLNRYVVRSRISEAVFRRFVRHVAADLTAVQITQLTGLNRNTVNRFLAGLRLRVLHGRLPAEEKDELMRRFAAGDIDVLVSTTVID